MVTLGDTEETGWGTVITSTFVSVTLQAVEMVECILVCSSAFAAYDEIFVSVASLNGVTKV